MTDYNEQFFDHMTYMARRSAQVIVPLAYDIARPTSVVDVGCGTGVWLSEFAKLGVQDVLGIDGSYVSQSQLVIKPEQFLAHDLTQPIPTTRTFDLALCLEVAEHLPATSAAQLVEQLTTLAPIVLFSAAIPGQGGTHHINEQWQSYWAEHFDARGYAAVDCIRSKVWNDKSVFAYYAQNMLLYVKRGHAIASTAAYGGALAHLSVVHPDVFAQALSIDSMSLKTTLQRIPYLLRRSIAFRLRRR
jgi:SAM-dependent methyltransferase